MLASGSGSRWLAGMCCSNDWYATPLHCPCRPVPQALEEDSDAAYVALPTSDIPAMGSWVDQTAWQVPARTVE